MGAVEDPNLLRRISLFQGLGLAQLAQLNRLLHFEAVPAGSRLIAAEQSGDTVYVILEGTVKVRVPRAGGGETVLAYLGPGDTVGEMSLVESCGRSADVLATEPVRLLWMDRPTFHSCLQRMGPLAVNLMRLLASRLRFANEQIQALSIPDLHGRLARQLLALADRYGCQERMGEAHIPLRLSTEDLAGLSGASCERVEELMAEFRDRGYLSLEAGGRIRVLAREEVARCCCQGRVIEAAGLPAAS